MPLSNDRFLVSAGPEIYFVKVGIIALADLENDDAFRRVDLEADRSGYDALGRHGTENGADVRRRLVRRIQTHVLDESCRVDGAVAPGLARKGLERYDYRPVGFFGYVIHRYRDRTLWLEGRSGTYGKDYSRRHDDVARTGNRGILVRGTGSLTPGG